MDDETRRYRERLEIEEQVPGKKYKAPVRYRELDEDVKNLIQFYAPALTYIGVNLRDPEVEEVICDCTQSLETVFRIVIAYWHILQDRGETLNYPNKLLVKAVKEELPLYRWRDEWMENPAFKSLGRQWEVEAKHQWGSDLFNSLVSDLDEDMFGTKGTIVFRTGPTVDLQQARRMSWEDVLKRAQSGCRQI